MSRFTRTALAGASALAALALITGCASGAGTPAASESDAAPQQGGTLTYLEPQTWTTLYPPSAGFYPNGGLVNNITDRLLYQNPETLELEPWIATDYTVNDDATEYTFDLRQGVTYSDGTPLTAANVVKNIDLYGKGDKDRALPVSEAINNYDHGEVVDDDTVVFHFTAPSPGFAQAVSTINSGLLSDATLDRASEGFGPGNATDIIGSGPFVISGEEIGTKTSVTARKDYDWAPASLKHQGAAYLDGVDYVVAAENSVRVGTVVAGQADIARNIPAPDEAQFAASGLSLYAAATNGVNNGLSFRFRDARLEDVRVRQAIIAGIDRQQIVDTLLPPTTRSRPARSPRPRSATSTPPSTTRTTPTRPRSCSTRPAGRSAATARARRTARSCRSPSTRHCRSRARKRSSRSSRSSWASSASGGCTPTS